jgi:hypothetical protein
VDLVVAGAAENAPEQRHVGTEGEDVEADRDQDPVPLGLVEIAHRLVRAHDLREQNVDPDHEQQHQEDAGRDLAAILEESLEAAYLELVGRLVRRLLVGGLERQLLGGGAIPVIGSFALFADAAALVRRHQPACGSSRCTAAAIIRIAGSTRGATRQIPSASANPASRSIR